MWAFDLGTDESRLLAGLAHYGPNDAYDGLSVSPDGRLVAGQAVGGGTGVWETVTGRKVLTLPGDKPSHTAVIPATRTLVAVRPGELAVLDLATGRERFHRPLPQPLMEGGMSVYGLACTPDGRRAVTALPDGTALVWDLTTPAFEVPAREVGEKELSGWWADLADADAGRAYAATWKLAAGPTGRVIPFLRARLDEARAESAAVARLVADLDSDSFEAREAATRRLERLGETVAPALREALAKVGSPEVRQRLERVLARVAGKGVSAWTLRNLRAVAVLELVGTADARRLLEELAKGDASAPETREAKAALGWMGRWSGNPDGRVR